MSNLLSVVLYYLTCKNVVADDERESGFVGIIIALLLLAVAVLFLAAMGNSQSGAITGQDFVCFVSKCN